MIISSLTFCFDGLTVEARHSWVDSDQMLVTDQSFLELL